jgi:hypothetical protein
MSTPLEIQVEFSHILKVISGYKFLNISNGVKPKSN